MARTKRTPEQNRRYYQNRQQAARTQGERSYGALRYKQQKAKLAQLQHQTITRLLHNAEPDAVPYDTLNKSQQDMYDRITRYGIDRKELDGILQQGYTDSNGIWHPYTDNPWKALRPILERESELAKGH